MTLDRQIQTLLADLQRMPRLWEVPLELLRHFSVPRAPEEVPLRAVEDVVIETPAGPLGGRLYTPEPGVLPLLVWFHGGGFVLGNLDSHDGICRKLALAADCAVLAVDYRLAPEHRFPAAVDDALAAVRWAAAAAGGLGIDPARIAVGGDSAGGNLAAVTALRIRDEGGPVLAAQLLVYPVTTHYDPPTGSQIENGDGYFLTRQGLKWFLDQYLPDDTARRHPHFALLSVPDLGRLPPAWVVTAEYDPLRDEGEAYAERLRASGIAVELHRHDGMIHGFFGMPGIDAGQRAIEDAGGWLKSRFGA
jgi:acetyl esterase